MTKATETKPAGWDDKSSAETVKKTVDAATAAPPTETETKPLDTKDEAAKQFVESGASAVDIVGDQAGRTTAEIREQAERKSEVTDALADANINRDTSAHNTNVPPAPVGVDYADRPDYNPQRRPSSKANQQSSLAESPRDMAERVDDKKHLPTNAEIVTDRRNAADEFIGEQQPGYVSNFKGDI